MQIGHCKPYDAAIPEKRRGLTEAGGLLIAALTNFDRRQFRVYLRHGNVQSLSISRLLGGPAVPVQGRTPIERSPSGDGAGKMSETC